MKKNNPLYNAAKTLLSSMKKRDMEDWPPDCVLFTYQPVRPYTHSEKAAESDTTSVQTDNRN